MKQNSKKLKENEEVYVHVTKRGLKYFCLSIFLFIVNILNFILLRSVWLYLDLKDLSPDNIYHMSQLIIIYPVLQQYLLLCVLIVSIVSMFKKLKSFKEEGLIFGLIYGLIGGLIFGLIASLIFGLTEGLMSGLIAGLIASLIGSLIIGLIIGLIEEFN